MSINLGQLKVKNLPDLKIIQWFDMAKKHVKLIHQWIVLLVQVVVKKCINNAQSYEKSYPRKYCQNHYLVLDQVILFAIDSLSKYKIHIFYFFLSQKIFKLSAQQILCFID